jgi:predicted RNase H-like HicB family nuclease
MRSYTVTFDREEDGRWIAELEELGVLVYGVSREDAYQRAKAAALFALSGVVEEGGQLDDSFSFKAAAEAA